MNEESNIGKNIVVYFVAITIGVLSEFILLIVDLPMRGYVNILGIIVPIYMIITPLIFASMTSYILTKKIKSSLIIGILSLLITWLILAIIFGLAMGELLH